MSDIERIAFEAGWTAGQDADGDPDYDMFNDAPQTVEDAWRVYKGLPSVKDERIAALKAQGRKVSQELECPNCGSFMILRVNKTTQQKFWGCSNFPKCKGTLPYDEEDWEDFEDYNMYSLRGED